MEYKLNSFKTFKDNGILVICGMIIALFGMLLPMSWGASYSEEVKAESETETAGTMETEFPFSIETNSKSCEEEIKQELRNIISGIQDKDGFTHLIGDLCNCDYKQERVDRAVDQKNNNRYPGELNKEGNAQEMPIITGVESHERFIELANKYNLPADLIRHTENYYGLKEGTILCLAITETSGGKKGYGVEGCRNYGNVANNDRGNRRCFANQGAGLAAIGATLNNDMLKNNQTISCLNGAGECIEPNASSYRYATSKSGNWERNMIGCFYTIYQHKINPQTFNLHERN